MQPQAIDQRIEALSLIQRQPVLAACEEDRFRKRICRPGPRHEFLIGQRERRLSGNHLDSKPCARLIAFVQMVVDQPGVTRERDALARAREIGLVHDAVLIVGQFVGGGGEQIDQHLVVIGLAGAFPAGHALGHRDHQGVTERVVVLGEIVDRRTRLGRTAFERRRAVIGEAAGPELEAERAEEWIDPCRVPDEFERVGRVVADRLDTQRQALRIDSRRPRSP